MQLITRILLLSLIFLPLIGFSQSQSSDLAINHNRLIQQKTADGVYKRIGTYKVIGTPFLFGEKNRGDLFSAEAKANSIYLSYNTYNQQLEFYSTSNPDQPLVKEPGEVDSFVLHPNAEIGFSTPLKFIWGKYIGSKENAYYQEIYAGPKYSIYKKYKSDLGYVSTNYIQSELRQFDLLLDYFYLERKDNKLKKIRGNAGSVIKEFKDVTNLSAVINQDLFDANPDAALRKAFETLNN